jgi:hypothetical protein
MGKLADDVFPKKPERFPNGWAIRDANIISKSAAAPKAVIPCLSKGCRQKCHVWTAPSWHGKTLRRRLGRCSHVFGLYVRFT